MLWKFSLREKLYWCFKNKLKSGCIAISNGETMGKHIFHICNCPSCSLTFIPTFVTLKCFELSHSASSDSSRNHLNRVCLNMRQTEVFKINIWIQHSWHLTVRKGLQRYSSGFRTQAQWLEPKCNKNWSVGTVVNLPGNSDLKVLP